MQEIVHTGRKIRVAIDTSIAADGSTIRRDMIFHPGAVVILPLIDENHVCLLKNYRFVINQELWELPAGTLEPGEPLEAAAQRELQEETGYIANEWRYLGFLYASPGVLDEKLHLFVAQALTPGTAAPEADEQLTPHTVAWVEALRMVMAGEIQDCKTVTGILWYDRLRNMQKPSP